MSNGSDSTSYLCIDIFVKLGASTDIRSDLCPETILMLSTGRRWLLSNSRPETLGRLALPVNILLVMAVADALAELTWSLLPPPPLTMPVEQLTIRTNDAPTVTDVNYTTIASWHLFGQVQESASAPQPIVTAAPETKLNFKLAGIFFTEEGKGRSLALIVTNGSKADIYALGDTLPGGVQIARIYRNHIVLSRNGDLEKLSLPRESRSIDSTANTSLPQANTGISPGGRIIDASAVVKQVQQSNGTPAEAIHKLALLDPYVENDQFIGFRLRPGQDRRLLAQLGLRAGDIITEVNGTRLYDPGQGPALLQEISQADQVSVRIRRNGNEIPFTFVMTSQ